MAAVKRRLLNIATAVSLMLCTVTVVLSVRGFWSADTFAVGKWWRDGTVMFDRSYHLMTNWHDIGINYTTETAHLTPHEQERLHATPWSFSHGTNEPPSFRQWSGGPREWPYGPPGWMTWLGFSTYHFRDITRGDAVNGPLTCDQTIATVPSWLVVMVFALIPAWRLWKRIRFARPGACRTCGYDLRATLDRCPECGTRVIQAQPKPAEGAVV
jgi:hypothetical protein